MRSADGGAWRASIARLVAAGAVALAVPGVDESLAQRLDLDGPAAPALPDGGALGRLSLALGGEADAFRAGLRGLGDDAGEVERLAMSARIAVTELIVRWIDAGADDGDRRIAMRRVHGLALASALGAFDEACRSILVDPSLVHPGRVLSLRSLLCLSDGSCPGGAARAGDDSWLVRAIAGAMLGVIADRAVSSGASRAPRTMLRSARSLGWSDEGLFERWDEIARLWASGGVSPDAADWVDDGLSALDAVVARIIAMTNPRDAARLEALRALLGEIAADGPAAGRPRGVAELLEQSVIADRAFRTIDALGATREGRRPLSAAERGGLDAGRAIVVRRWMDGTIGTGFARSVSALERANDSRSRAERGGGHGGELPGSARTAQRLRVALDEVESELVRRLESLLGNDGSAMGPDMVSLLSRHEASAARLERFQSVSGWISLLRAERSQSVEALLIARMIQQLLDWQRDAGASDPVAERAHAALASFERLSESVRGLRAVDLVGLADRIERTALARADWNAALLAQRARGFRGLLDGPAEQREFVETRAVSERLEWIALLARSVGHEDGWAAGPLVAESRGLIEAMLAALRDDSFGRSLEPMRGIARIGAGADRCVRLVGSDAVARGALLVLMGMPPGDPAELLAALREAGQPWDEGEPARAEAGRAVRWIGELNQAGRLGEASDRIEAIRESLLWRLEAWDEADRRRR